MNYAIIKLRAEKGYWGKGVTPLMRLRAALKRLKRDYGLRAVACEICQDEGPQQSLGPEFDEAPTRPRGISGVD